MNDLYPPPITPTPRRGMPAWGIALIAICIAVVLAAVFAGGVAVVKKIAKRGEEKRKANAELARTANEVRSDMRREMETQGSVSVETSLKSIDKVRAQIEQGSAAGGDGAKVSKAYSDLLGEIGRVMKAYGEIVHRIEKDPPLDISTIKTRDDLTRRRALGKEMLEGNQKLAAVYVGAEKQLRASLEGAGVKPSVVESSMRGFMTGFASKLPIQRRIRQTDEVIGKGIVELCDLLEAEWGKWRMNKDTPIFDSEVAAAKYNSIQQRVAKAADEQAAAQRELLKAAQ